MSTYSSPQLKAFSAVGDVKEFKIFSSMDDLLKMLIGNSGRGHLWGTLLLEIKDTNQNHRGKTILACTDKTAWAILRNIILFFLTLSHLFLTFSLVQLLTSIGDRDSLCPTSFVSHLSLMSFILYTKPAGKSICCFVDLQWHGPKVRSLLASFATDADFFRSYSLQCLSFYATFFNLTCLPFCNHCSKFLTSFVDLKN